MRPYLIFLVLAVLITLVYSCSKEEVTQKVGIKKVVFEEEIKGEWVWLRSIGGYNSEKITPESLGITKAVIITDSIFTELINDTISFQAPYTFYGDSYVGVTHGHIEIVNGPTYLIRIDNILALVEPGFHEYDHYYVRK